MYVRIINSLTAQVLAEGETEHPPQTFDYITHDNVEYLVVQRVSKMELTEQGPWNNKILTHLMSIYVEEPSETNT